MTRRQVRRSPRGCVPKTKHEGGPTRLELQVRPTCCRGGRCAHRGVPRLTLIDR